MLVLHNFISLFCRCQAYVAINVDIDIQNALVAITAAGLLCLLRHRLYLQADNVGNGLGRDLCMHSVVKRIWIVCPFSPQSLSPINMPVEKCII